MSGVEDVLEWPGDRDLGAAVGGLYRLLAGRGIADLALGPVAASELAEAGQTRRGWRSRSAHYSRTVAAMCALARFNKLSFYDLAQVNSALECYRSLDYAVDDFDAWAESCRRSTTPSPQTPRVLAVDQI